MIFDIAGMKKSQEKDVSLQEVFLAGVT
jgi:hypothetical protein